jgi:hypothetical protein
MLYLLFLHSQSDLTEEFFSKEVTALLRICRVNGGEIGMCAHVQTFCEMRFRFMLRGLDQQL